MSKHQLPSLIIRIVHRCIWQQRTNMFPLLNYWSKPTYLSGWKSTLIHTALRWGAEIGAGFFEPLRTRTKSLDEADDSHKASTSWAVSLRQSWGPVPVKWPTHLTSLLVLSFWNRVRKSKWSMGMAENYQLVETALPVWWRLMCRCFELFGDSDRCPEGEAESRFG